MKIRPHSILLLLLLGIELFASAVPVQARRPFNSISASDLIAAVNVIRSGKGLAELQVNASLMSAAQAHSDYQASIGSWTHSGANGSRPIDRAAAAGYGNGAKIFVSENVARLSTTGDIDYLINTVWIDSVHWSTMTNAQYTDCGVGVSERDGYVYYTLDVGYVSGSVGTSVSVTSAPSSAVTAAGTSPAATSKTLTVEVATQRADGAIVHEVKAGETLYSIVEAYRSTLTTLTIPNLRALNNIGEKNNTLYIGQKLLIKPAYTATMTPTITDTPVPPTRTLKPTQTKGPSTQTFTPGPTRTLTPRPLLPQLSSLQSNPRQSIGIILVVVCGLSLAAILLNNLLKKNHPKS